MITVRCGATRYGAPHNVVGHTLLVLWPRAGRWVHERTSPRVPTWGARLHRRLIPSESPRANHPAGRVRTGLP